MEKYMRKVYLTFDGEDSNKVIIVKQYDTARELDIVMLKNDERMSIPTGAKATFRALKPDGKSTFLRATISEDGVISVDLTDQTLAVAGVVRADVALEDAEGNTISTSAFALIVRPSPMQRELQSENEWQEMQDATASCNQLVEDLTKAWELGDLDGFSPTIEVNPIMGGNRVTITDRNGPHIFDVFNGDGSGTFFTPGDGLKMTMTKDGSVLSVDAADDAEQDNTKPITSAAVYRELGNIEALLATI